MTALEAPWQNGMVERDGGFLGDIIEAIVLETSPVGFQQICEYVYSPPWQRTDLLDGQAILLERLRLAASSDCLPRD